MEESALRAVGAEAVATFALVLIGAGAVIVAGPYGGGLVGIALAHGFVLAAMVSVTAHVSGGSVNPAVTIGLWVAGRLGTRRAVAYVIAEALGGITGALVLRGLVPQEMWKAANLGAPALARGIGAGRGVLIEAAVTFLLTLTVFGTIVGRDPSERASGLSVGLVAAVGSLAFFPFTGAAMNPARALGPEVAVLHFADWWVYWVGPIAGAVIAAVLYSGLFLRREERRTP